MSREVYRSRTHLLMLYPEDETHMNALKKIEKSYDYAYILHDKDRDENGNIKKSHYHVVIRFTNQKWNTSVAKELNIAENYLEEPRNFDNALMYLIHFNDVDKYQYNIDDVKGPLKKRLREKINSVDKTEGEKVFELIDYIEKQENIIKVTEFAKYCAVNGYWAEFRRSGMIFCKMIEEHNSKLNVKMANELLKKNQEQLNKLAEDYRMRKKEENGKWVQATCDFEKIS